MSQSKSTQVLMVGHCMPDAFMLKRAIRKAIPGATTHRVNSEAKLQALAPDADLLLVNRVLDGSFESGDGVDLIRRLRADNEATATPAMLVSNYADAQLAAQEAGACPGVGKSDMFTEESQSRFRKAAQA